ncbi:NAD-dependent epimerase/dehydratase family protein [Paracoccus sp. 22332]|uniref:NAD-dependent epimerase/dehydratase family protein n=1 Tax=Paracoccus sp. 22332 TaxID=3453913 RepID=UPI003F82FE86
MSDSARAVLVTGAAGFIGHRITQALMDRGRRVIGTDVRAPSGDIGCDFYVADARDALRHAPMVAGCDSIIHCGGISGPMVMTDNPAEVIDINISGTAGLLALARSFGLRRFVGLSSVSAYGDTPGRDLVDETAPLTATNAYGTSKAASDLLIQSHARSYGLSAVALRIGWVYGPGRVTDAIIQPAMRSSATAPYVIAEGGDHLLQFVHVDDVVEAVLAAWAAEALPSAAYNVNGAEVLSVRDICRMVAERHPAARIEVGSGTLPGSDVQGQMDLSLAARELGWSPRVSFSQGLTDYVEWLKDHAF